MKKILCLLGILLVAHHIYSKPEIALVSYHKKDTIDLNTLRVNGKITFFSEKQTLNKILGKPDSTIFYGIGVDSLIISYYGNLSFLNEGNTLAFHIINLRQPSDNHITINGHELTTILTPQQIMGLYADEGWGELYDSVDIVKQMQVLWCPLKTPGYADKVKFIFEYGHLVEIAAWIDD